MHTEKLFTNNGRVATEHRKKYKKIDIYSSYLFSAETTIGQQFVAVRKSQLQPQSQPQWQGLSRFVFL